MKIEPGQMCMNCSDRPATVAQGTVPLCAECAGVADGRGVKLRKTKHPKPDLVKCD
jgi:hypothetical protein